MGQVLDLVKALGLDQAQTWVPELPLSSPEQRIGIDLVAGPAPADDEQAFRQWYTPWAARYGMNPDPDAPEQDVDYRAAFKAGVQPPNVEHGEWWPEGFTRALRPDPGAPKERPPQVPGPGSVLGMVGGLTSAPAGAFLGSLLDKPGQLGPAARAAWETVKTVPETVFKPAAEQGLTSPSQELTKRGVEVPTAGGLMVDLALDPQNLVGGEPITDLSKIGVLGMAAIPDLGRFAAGLMHGDRAAALAQAIGQRFPRFAEALLTSAPPAVREAAPAVTHTMQIPIEVGGRTIPVYATRPDDVLVPINLEAFDQAWAKETGFHLPPTGENRIRGRYERAAEFVTSGQPMEAPRVTVTRDGRVGFSDGRHRTAVLRDQGVRELPMAMTPESAANAERLGLFRRPPPELPRPGELPMGVALEERDGHLLYAPAAQTVEGRAIMSTRVPTAKKLVAPVSGAPLVTDLSVILQSPETTAKIAERLRASTMLTPAEQRLPDVELLDAFVEKAKRNLLKLWDDTPEAIRAHSRQWYEGAHARMMEDATALGITPEQSAALLAVLSPQNDWFVNAELARRIGYTWKELSQLNAPFTSDLFAQYKASILNTEAPKLRSLSDADRAAAEAALATATDEKTIKTLTNRLKRPTPDQAAMYRQLLDLDLKDEAAQWVGVPFNELSLEGKARMVRAFSHQAHPRLSYNMILPDGSVGPVVRNAPSTTPKTYGLRTPTKFKWSVSYAMIEDALSVLEDQRLVNISQRLGGEHKVRSFYNNILAPWDARSVTIDTHAVAAAHLQPFAQSAPEVNYVMGGVGDAELGISGANAVYAEAYNRAARDRGVLPREMQSVTWESVRGLFSPGQKRTPGFVKYIRELWKEHNTGKLSLEDLYERITTASGGIDAPAWADHLGIAAR